MRTLRLIKIFLLLSLYLALIIPACLAYAANQMFDRIYEKINEWAE